MKKQAIIIDGTGLAKALKKQLAQKIKTSNHRPGLAAVLVGNDPASDLYVRLKENAALEVGIDFHKYLCNEDCYQDISQAELLKLIDFFNDDKTINGILIQLPLPEKYQTQKIINRVSPAKDVDGFHPKNTTNLIPPTIAAVITLLKATHQDLSDLSALVIGASDIFTRKLKKYITQELPIKKIDLKKSIPKNSNTYDIIIIAIGQAKALKKSMVKDNAIVIDVGINKTKQGKTVGDVDPSVKTKAGFISPVPGGVGPLTVAHVLENTFKLTK